jgi:hypothetical protein
MMCPKKVFAKCREKFCSINDTPIGCLIDGGMRTGKERYAGTSGARKQGSICKSQ